MRTRLTGATKLAVVATMLIAGGHAWAGSLDSRSQLGSTNAPGTPISYSNNNIVKKLEKMGNFSILLTALETANLKGAVSTGGPFTLFAPTDAAFADLLSRLNITAPELLANPDLAKILLYHVASGNRSAAQLLKSSTQPTLSDGRSVLVVLEGTSVLVNRAKVTRANVPGGNGTIHVIDKVLLPPAEPVSIDNLLDVLALDGRFSILLTALELTGLDDAVAAPGPFTLFAPTDDAFARLLADLNITADQLLANPDLSKILLYHVLGRRAGAIQLLASGRATTLEGSNLSVRLRRDGVYIDDSRVINPNINTPNGVIHTLDKVLIP
jgi:transforming growth factor-beta-induced protein